MPQDNPFLLGGSASGAKPKPNPFLLNQSSGGGTKPKPNPFLLGGQSSSAQSESLPVLEQEVQDVGAPAPAQDSPGVFRRIADIAMRPTYAVAGTAQELLTPQGGGLEAVPGRIANEIFSGIGTLKGKKEGFGQVMEEAGVPDLGHFSDVAPFLYNDTGEGIPLQKGGWADPTGRGTIGTALDIFADPVLGPYGVSIGVGGKTAQVAGEFLSKTGQKVLTAEATKAATELGVRAQAIAKAKALDPLLTSQAANSALGKTLATAAPILRDLSVAKAKERVAAAIAGGADLLDKGGIKWNGIHLADNPLAAVANSGVAKDLAASLASTKAGQMALASVAWTKKYTTDVVANLFIKGYGVRGLPQAEKIMADSINKEGWLKGAAYREMENSPFKKWAKLNTKQRDAIFKPVIDAFQSGGMAAVPAEFQPAMKYYANKVDEMFANEVASGLLTKTQKLQNYFAHYYRNDPEDLARVVYMEKGGAYNTSQAVESMLRMGRNAEERAYPTLKDAVEGSTKWHAQDASVPILEPIYDPVESLSRRWDHSITKRMNREMVDNLEKVYGPLDLKDVYDLATPVKYGAKAAQQQMEVHALLAAPSRDFREAASTGTKVFQTPELRLASDNLKKAWDDLPIKYREEQTLKNLDEVSYFRRRGWDVVENPADASRGKATYKAYRVNEVGQREYASFSSKLEKAKNQVAAATKRATREVDLPGELTKGTDKLAELSKFTDSQKRDFFLQRFQQIGDREEANAVLQKYEPMKEFFPTRLVNESHFAADGTPFMPLKDRFTDKVWMLPESLAKEVASMSDVIVKNKHMRQALQGYDTLTNFWKGSVTWLFPGFHIRNLYGNVSQSLVDIAAHSLNPASYVETAQILFGKGPGTFKTELGSYTYDEARNFLNRNGINTSAAAKAEFTGNTQFFDKVGGVLGWARNAGTAIENESRAQLGLNYLRRGMDQAEAGARVKKFQLDYANGLTSFERQFMKRAIPFYAFQRMNLGLMMENLAKRPGMAVTQIKPFLGRNSENEAMTSWDAGALKLRLNRDGKTVQMITGVDLPIRNLDLLFRGNLQETLANAVGMLAPIPKTFIEGAAGKSLFTGKDFGRTNSPMAGRAVEHMPTPIQKWMGYKKEIDAAGKPKYTFDGQRFYLLAQSYATSRFLSTADRQWNKYLGTAKPNELASLLDFVTGLRFQEMNMDEEMQKRAEERKKDLENSLIRWGQRQEFERVYKSKKPPPAQ